MLHLLAFCLGFLLDFALGDPKSFPHIVVGMGKLITALEGPLRKIFSKSPSGEKAAGLLLVLLLGGSSYCLPFFLLHFLRSINIWLCLPLEIFLCWQCLAMQGLKKESLLVKEALDRKDLPGARTALSMIVGRDTEDLDEPGIIRAAVETISENSSDGVIAPMLYLALGGAPLGVLYKAINTMDSMLGYHNKRYEYFGRVAAKLDDIANFIPARVTALLSVWAAFVKGFDGRNAWRILRRDRKKHKSPNSAHPEAAYAGALHIQLAGNAFYFGKLLEKPFIGNADRPVEGEDIVRANWMMICSSWICFLLCVALKGFFVWL